MNRSRFWVSSSAVILPRDGMGPQIQRSNTGRVHSYFYDLLKFLFILLTALCVHAGVSVPQCSVIVCVPGG